MVQFSSVPFTGFPPLPCCLLLELPPFFLLEEAERKGVFGRGLGGLMGGWWVDPFAFEEAEWRVGWRLVGWLGGWGFGCDWNGGKRNAGPCPP